MGGNFFPPRQLFGCLFFSRLPPQSESLEQAISFPNVNLMLYYIMDDLPITQKGRCEDVLLYDSPQLYQISTKGFYIHLQYLSISHYARASSVFLFHHLLEDFLEHLAFEDNSAQ